MRRTLAAALVAAFVALPAGTASASGLIGTPGGQCDGVVDTMCRQHVCQPDELDCGLIPPCFLWVAVACVL